MVHPIVRGGGVVALVLGAGVGVWALLGAGSNQQAPREGAPVGKPSDQELAAASQQQASEPAATPGPQGPAAKPAEKKDAGVGIGNHGKPPKGVAVFPDGTWLPPLNGCPFAPGPCPWPSQVPYSPVVEIVTGDKGIQWYIHADGSTSNTQMVTREEGGKKWLEPGWAVGNPTKALPVDLGDSKRQPPTGGGAPRIPIRIDGK